MSECLLMAHLVAGYPDMETSFAVARALAEGGADYLEVQFPFSDPTADGPVIEHACQRALAGGFRVEDGFRLMRRLADSVSVPLFIMTYGSLVFARGAEDFARRAAEAGVRGLIIPDLPPDYDENLFEAGRGAGLAVVPVIAPEITERRLAYIGSLGPEYIYTALRLGITGSRTELDSGAMGYLERVGGLGARVVGGFGVRSREQMEMLGGRVHAAAVGSYFLEVLNNAGENYEEALRKAAMELKGRKQEH